MPLLRRSSSSPKYSSGYCGDSRRTNLSPHESRSVSIKEKSHVSRDARKGDEASRSANESQCVHLANSSSGDNSLLPQPAIQHRKSDWGGLEVAVGSQGKHRLVGLHPRVAICKCPVHRSIADCRLGNVFRNGFHDLTHFRHASYSSHCRWTHFGTAIAALRLPVFDWGDL